MSQAVGQMPTWSPSPAIVKLRTDHEAAIPALGAERALHYTQYYKSSTEPSAALRKAGALADHLARRTIRIEDGEPIVGHHTEHRIGAICHVELAGVAMLADLFRFETRTTNPLHVDPQARRELLLSAAPYWISRNLVTQAFPLRQRIQYVTDQTEAARFIINEAGGIAHFLPDFPDLIASGTDGLRARIVRRLERGDLSPAQRDQLQANLVSLHAVECFSDRHRELARQIGRDDVAATLSNVPRRPATSLKDALQMIWFFQLIIQIESLDQGISLGRMDRYLYPLYISEVSRGTFNADEFRDLACAFCLKLSEVIPLFSDRLTEMFAGLPTGQALTIGGTGPDGEDAANELTFLFLDVIDKFKTRQPNWHARLSARSGKAYVERVFQVIAGGGGSPALYNDDAIIPSMRRRFDAPDLVWNYATVGCVEPALPGVSYTSSDAAIFNFARILERVLTRHRPKAMRLRTTAPAIDSMDDLLAALEEELRSEIRSLKTGLEAIERSNAKSHPVPFSSLTVDGCIERALDLTEGGARYNASGIQAVGIADLANSLAAIDEVVFQRREVSLADVAIACAQDFKGQPALKSKLANVEKFGNDKARVDHFAGMLTELFDRVISENINTRGGRWMPGLYSMTCHRSMGAKTGALPSGRGRGEALADGIAPCDGSDRLGPTATLNSAAKLGAGHAPNGVNLNLKFDANTVKGPAGGSVMAALVKGYFRQGGMQVQINVLDPDVLVEAQRAPENHRNLLVRVSGYSAYFVDLTPAMQNEIIDRTRQRA